MSYPHEYSIPVAVTAQIAVPSGGDGCRLFSDLASSQALAAKKRDGTTHVYTGFVSGVQDVGKGEFRWTTDNGADNGIYLERVYPTEVTNFPVAGSTAPPFVVGTGCFTNPNGSRKNQVWSCGWNMGAGGGAPVVTGEPAIGIGFETCYSADASTDDYMEHHIYTVSAVGDQQRPFSMIFNRTTAECQTSYNAKRLTFGYHAGGLQTMVIQHGTSEGDASTVTLGRFGQLTVGLRAETNNTGFLSQNSTVNGVYVEIARVNASNQVEIGNGGVATKIAGNVGFNGATPAAKPTISGSRAGNAALADLLTKLAATGLITDGTSA